MSELISKEDVARALKLERIRLKVLAPAVMRLLQLHRINNAYASGAGTSGAAFADRILQQFGINYEVSEEDLRQIPKTGPFIVIANHPYGGIDGILMLSLISKVRPDLRIVANYLLQQIPELKDAFIAVNPFENIGSKGMNLTGVKQILEHLKTAPLGIFPAGEVSALSLNNFRIRDKKWEPVVGKIIAKSGVPVVPMFFSGHNSIAFNLMGLLHPGLRTIKLPSEMLNKSASSVQIRIGKPIQRQELSQLSEDQVLDLLRARTYALGEIDKEQRRQRLKLRLRPLARPRRIIREVNRNEMQHEIDALPEKAHLFDYDNFSVYIASAKRIPLVLREISRLREVVFREVGEGTNRSCDTDHYDKYYKHLFVWDRTEKKIAGAYRIGEGDVIFRLWGLKGFYLNELFKISKELHPLLYRSIELGRSFVALEYQRRPASLMLLWKGIHVFLKKNPGRFQYMIGPVSISNSFSHLSKDLLVAYVRHNHWDVKLARMVEPKKPYHYKSRAEGKLSLIKRYVQDLRSLDSFIAEVEGDQKMKVPVLIKKYLKLNGKIIAFNVDPDFNYSLDGFLVVDLETIPDEAFDMVSR